MKRQVVVTTDNTRRGVFYGTLKSYDADKQYCVLTDAKMVVYWSSETKGVVGLAAIGPQSGSRLTPAIPQIELNGVTAVMDCTAKAVKTFSKEVWS